MIVRSHVGPITGASECESRTPRCRLLYVIGQLETGGSERQLCWFLEALDRDRYKPAVVVWSMSEDTEFAEQIRCLGVPIYGWSSATSPVKKIWNHSQAGVWLIFRRVLACFD